MNDMNGERELNAKEAARYLNVSTWWLWFHRKHNDGPKFVKKSTRKIVYFQSDIDRWIEERRA